MTTKTDVNAMQIERRNGVRAPRVVAIRHRLVRNLSKNDGDSQWSLSTTKNMSVSGLLFLSETGYAKGDLIELEVVMSGVIEIHKGYAEVVRVHESSAKAFDVAVKYVEAKPQPRPAKSHLR